LWTPFCDADRAACDPACNNCGQVCPTGAIRALPIEEKRAVHMGRAVVRQDTCIMCGQCSAACPYNAITWEPGSWPVVDPYRCVGCGACQATCMRVNVREQGLLRRPAIVVEAGPGLADRMMNGSYIELHRNDPIAPPPEPEWEPDFLNEFLSDH
jgi:ferredoxin